MTEVNKKPIVAVIGGGPAGLLAAGTAASYGSTVLLFEKNPQCGRKLLITGSGRCNVTNNAPFNLFLDQYPENKKFLYPAFREFFVEDLQALFHRYNLTLVSEESGKCFPETQKASSVLDVLLAFCKDHRVAFHYKEPVLELSSRDAGWTVKTAGGQYQADSVIIATGGLSYPVTGSVGDGYRLAASLSHSLVPVRPALVPFKISHPDCAPLSGISLKDVPVTLWDKSAADTPRKVATQRGDLLFTHFGVSGPPVLFLSRWLPAGYDSTAAANYQLAVDLLPSLSALDLENMFLKIFGTTPNRQLKTVLGKDFEIPHAVAAQLVTHCGFKEDIICQDITKAYRKMIVATLKSFDLAIARTRGYKEAMVTAGGISTKEIDPKTMESKLRPGLFFAGEVIDIDGFTGGYNLQAAFSTGYLAGKSAAGHRTLE